jgi:peptidoglycan/LPS O-acetylase OafA/YrhL
MTAVPGSANVTAQSPDGGAAIERLPALDGLRGLAILLVMQFHFWGLAFGVAGWQPSLGIDRFFHRLFGTGWSGVDLFFVLSGFLITGVLYDAKHSSAYFRNFYARRFLRIFPLYYGFLAGALFVLPVWNRVSDQGQIEQLRQVQFWYWTYLVNLGSAIKPFHSNIPLVHIQFWSLALEEQFYLIWPLLMLLFSRRSMMLLCAVLVAGALATRYVLLDPVSAPFANQNAAHLLLPARVDTLALGAVLALALRGGIDLHRWKPVALVISAGALTVLTMLFIRHGGLTPLDRDVETVGLSALALLYASLLLLLLTAKPADRLHRLVSHASLRFLGRYSYAIYVFHLLVAFELTAEVNRRHGLHLLFGSQIPFNIGFSLTCTAISVTAAWLSWHVFEKHVQKLKRYVPYERYSNAGEGPATAQRATPEVSHAIGS